MLTLPHSSPAISAMPTLSLIKTEQKLLDAANVKDQDGDGDRDLPNGQEFRLNIQFATQGVAAQVVEIIAQNWSDVGITTSIKEVTSDEYRASQSANELDVHVWNKGEPLAVFLGDTAELVPPSRATSVCATVCSGNSTSTPMVKKE